MYLELTVIYVMSHVCKHGQLGSRKEKQHVADNVWIEVCFMINSTYMMVSGGINTVIIKDTCPEEEKTLLLVRLLEVGDIRIALKNIMAENRSKGIIYIT